MTHTASRPSPSPSERPPESPPTRETADPHAVDAAVDAAAACFADPAWSQGARRGSLLQRAAARLVERGDDVVATAMGETGLDEARLRGELDRTARQLELFADVVAEGTFMDAVIEHGQPGRPDLRRMRVPIGPVAVFGASNFPLAFGVAGGDTASAWGAGCPVVLKGHPAHPQTNALVAQELRAAVRDVELPIGAISLVQTAAVAVAEHLVDHPGIVAVAFTGSLRAGRSIFERASRRPVPIPVFAEMGSANPLIVTPAALERRAAEIAEGLAGSVLGSAGQLCTKPNVVLVPGGRDGERFEAALASTIAARPVGRMLTEQLRQGFEQGIARLRDADGVDLVATGPQPDQPLATSAVVLGAPATAIEAVPELIEEHFGPAVVLLRYQDLDELRAIVAALPGQLTATLHCEEAEAAELADLVALLRACAGRLVFNGFPTGVTVCEAIFHGGPYPATIYAQHTAVGTSAIDRFTRPVAYQDAPAALLPAALRDDNPLDVPRRVDGIPPSRRPEQARPSA